MDDVEDRSVKRGRRERGEGVLGSRLLDVGTDSELLNAGCEVLRDITALYGWSAAKSPCTSSDTTHVLTFMAMNFNTRYCVSTLITTSPSVWVSLSINGRRRACVWIRHLQASKRGRRG